MRTDYALTKAPGRRSSRSVVRTLRSVTGTVLALHLHGIDRRGDVSTTAPVPDAVSGS